MWLLMKPLEQYSDKRMTANQRASLTTFWEWLASLSLAAVLFVITWEIKLILSLLLPLHHPYFHLTVVSLPQLMISPWRFKGACESCVLWGKFYLLWVKSCLSAGLPRDFEHTACIHKIRLALGSWLLPMAGWANMSQYGQTFEWGPCMAHYIYLRKERLWNRRKLSGRKILSTNATDLHTCICWTHRDRSAWAAGSRALLLCPFCLR